jgi:hypothetical protein
VWIGSEIVKGIVEGLWEGLGGKALHDWMQGLGERIRNSLPFGLGRLLEGRNMPTVEELGLPAGSKIGATGRVKLPGQLTYGPMPSAAELETMRAAAEDLAKTRATAEVIPFRPPTAPTAPLAPPGAVMTPPSLLQQAKEAIPVRLDGEINNRLRVDMSPDLRAMLQEQRTSINLLRNQVEIGQSMGPAMGEAA